MGGLIDVTPSAAQSLLQLTVLVTSRRLKEARVAGPQRALGLAGMDDLIGGGSRSGQMRAAGLEVGCPREAGSGDAPRRKELAPSESSDMVQS